VDELFDLRGRVALVTGASSGIGRETAAVLACLGATVYATDRAEAGVRELVATLPNGAVALRHDVTSEDDWARVFEAIGRTGRLDVLVNNAGIMLKRGFLDTSLEDFRHQQRVNVESVFLGMRGALPLMLRTASDYGTSPSIINVASIYGQVAGQTFSAYSASKGAVRLLSKAVANEYAKARVRVNTIHPGAVMTNLAAGWEPPRDAAGNVITPEQARANIERIIPLGRMGTSNDVAGCIAFLASDASRYVTGSELTVDGGYTTI
jgi:NAD(P)-dependent dehydrogenase (short-subunit alcohol dehydrogenase family)